MVYIPEGKKQIQTKMRKETLKISYNTKLGVIVKVQDSEVRVLSCKFRVGDSGLGTQSWELRVASCKLQVVPVPWLLDQSFGKIEAAEFFSG